MKWSLPVAVIFALQGCAAPPAPPESHLAQPVQGLECPGDTTLPAELNGRFQIVDDPALLASALGAADAGKLCQARVYQALGGEPITLYRAWNSTNPRSELGRWWAARPPSGKVARYRADYAICHQWSALDKMTRCTLKAGAKVVIGTGQSARCSEHLTYPASAEKQIYLPMAASQVTSCTAFDGEFRWTR